MPSRALMTLRYEIPASWRERLHHIDLAWDPEVAAWIDPVCHLVKPVSKGLFAGALDIHKVPNFSDRVKFRLSVKLGVWTEGDHRDWPSIEDWAKRLIPLMDMKAVL